MSDIQKRVEYIRSKVSDEDKQKLLDKENVHSVGIGFEEGKPKKAQYVCLTVRVTDKKAKEQLKEQDIVPSEYLSIETDVIEEEIATVDEVGGNPGNDERLQTEVREAEFDVLSGGVAGSGAGNATVPGSARLLDEDNDVVTITNRHVACDETEDCTGDAIVQPTGSQSTGRQVGTTKSLGQLDPDGPDEDNVDVAIIDMDETVAEVSNRYYGLSEQQDFQEPELGQRVVNTGRRTGLISGEITEVDGVSNVGFDFGTTTFTGITRYSVATDGGDSGSITSIVDSNGDVSPVACHFAGSSSSGVGMPFGKIQDYLGNISVPTGSYDAPASDVDIDLLEPFCYNVSTSNDDIVIEYIVSNTGGSTFTETIELLDESDNLIDSTTYSNISPGEFTVDSFTIDSQYNNSELTLQSSDHIDYVQLDEEEDTFDANYVPQIVNTNSPVVAGETLTVDIDVENTTDEAENEFLDFFVRDDLWDFSEEFSFTGTQSFSFTYETDGDDIGDFQVTGETVNSANSDSTTVTVEEDSDAFFDIVIDSTNSPVEQGDDLEIDYTVTNTGSSGQSDISLSVDGSVEDTNESVELESDESISQTLVWSTSTSDRGDYTLTVDADEVSSDSDSTIGTVEKPATYLLNISQTNSPVKVGNKLEVDVEVENTGDREEEKELTFTVSDYLEDRFVWVDSGTTQIETFEWQTESGDVGEYTAQIEGEDDSDSETVEVREPFPPFFETSITSINSPVNPSSNLNVEYKVENTGEESDTQDIQFNIEDELEDTESNIELDGGESFSSDFVFEVQETEGEYSGSVDSEDDSSSFNYIVEDSSGIDFPIIDQDWDDIVIDDGTITTKANSYYAKVYSTNEETEPIRTEIDSIRYSPEVNSATGISIEVEPKQEFESEEYLGGILDVFVDKKPLFSGRVYKISTSQTEGDFYTIDAEPPGKELRNETIDESTDNFLLSDYIAKTIDKYNDWDDEHFNLIDTSQESLTDINTIGRGREATSDNSEIIYSDVGTDASIVDILYVKLSVSGSVDVTIQTANSSYTRTFTESEGEYGQWLKINPSELDSEEYDIKFEMTEDSVVFDWISLTTSEITRTVEPEIVDLVRDQETVQQASSDAQWENILNIEDTDPYKVEDGKLIPLETSFAFEALGDNSGDFTFEEFSDEYSDGEATGFDSFSNEGDTLRYSFTPEYDIENWSLIYREELVLDDENDDRVRVPGIDFIVDGDRIEGNIDGARFIPRDLRWDIANGQETLSAGDSIDIEFVIVEKDGPDSDWDEEDYGDWIFDVITLVDDRYYEDPTNTFDNEVHEAEGYLDDPWPYAKDNPALANFQEISTGEVIETGYLDVETNDLNGVAELGISFDGGNSFQTESNVTSIVKNNIGLTASISGRVGTKGWEDEPRNQTPRLGYQPQEIDLYELAVDTNSIEILFNQNVTGNRLKAITDIIDNSRLYYRWEGKDCRIFQRGSKKTDIQLKKEDVTSSVSIEDVYASCEVIGDGVSSGIIEADEAPEYVNRHKEIRDPDITLEDDAIRRARSFLEENSSVEYEADIRTLPTLAPLGEMVDGSNFAHGKDVFIESVNYGKRRSDIDLGKTKDLQTELLNLDRGVDSDRTRNTGI